MSRELVKYGESTTEQDTYEIQPYQANKKNIETSESLVESSLRTFEKEKNRLDFEINGQLKEKTNIQELLTKSQLELLKLREIYDKEKQICDIEENKHNEIIEAQKRVNKRCDDELKNLKLTEDELKSLKRAIFQDNISLSSTYSEFNTKCRNKIKMITSEKDEELLRITNELIDNLENDKLSIENKINIGSVKSQKQKDKKMRLIGLSENLDFLQKAFEKDLVELENSITIK